MIRYHVLEEKGHLYLIKSGISYHSAKIVQRRLKSKYPDRNFKIVANDVWANFLRSLDRF